MPRSLFKSICLFLTLTAVPSAFAAPVLFDSAWYEQEDAIFVGSTPVASTPIAAELLVHEVEVVDAAPAPQSAPMPAPTGLATLALAAGYCIVRRRS